MVGKLIATDLRQSWRPLLIVFGLVSAFTALGSVFVAFDVPFFNVIFNFLITIAPFALIAGVLVYLLARYYRTMYGRVGYFTMSVPASGRELFWAKLLYACIVVTAALVAAVIAYQPVWISRSIAADRPLAEGPKQLVELVRSWPNGAIALALGAAVMALLGYIIHYQFVITVGSEARFNQLGIGGPVVIYVIVYLVGQVLSIASFAAIPLMLKISPEGLALTFGSAWEFLTDAFKQTAPADVIPIGWAPLQIIMLGVLAWWAIRSIRLRTSLR